jgi:hypothetical protein
MHIYFLDFAQLKDLLPPMWLKPKKGITMIFHHVDQFLLLAIEVFGYLRKHANAFLHDHANVIWSLKGPKGVPFFLFWLFFLSKNFNYLAKDTIIFNLKLGSGSRPIYFMTSTFSRHPPPPIAMINLLQVIGCWDGRFLTFSLC